MSRYANFVIEYKDGNEWKTWSGLKRYVKHTYTTCVDGEIKQETNTPKYDTNELGKLDEVNFIWKQGIVRDLFDITYMGTELKQSGLPDNVSDHSKSIIDENMAYKTSTTYAYLSDIQEYADNELEKLFKDLESSYEKKYFYNAMIRQLNAISADLFKKKEISTKSESDEFDIQEDIHYATKEWIYDIIAIQAFCQEIRTLVEEIANVNVDDSQVRVICWID